MPVASGPGRKTSYMSDVPALCRSAPAQSMQLSDCIGAVELEEVSAIDQFEASLAACARTAAAIPGSAHPDVLAEMLVVAIVSSTESFFRTVLAGLASICPLTLTNIGDEVVPMRAAAGYPRQVLPFALLESSLFSTSGVIKKEIRRFTRFDIKEGSELSAAISAFELVAQIRHAAAHWRGYVDTRGARRLGLLLVEDQLLVDDRRILKLTATAEIVQRSLAVCDHLVHLANKTLLDFTVEKWLDSGLISSDSARREESLQACGRLLGVFGSKEYCAHASLDSEAFLDAVLSLAP